jgi:excinuclease ABC subunit B
MEDLRNGLFDVLVGVNLLREGLDLPEVSLVAILDADKEGFLRSHRSLTQTVGRAARNLNGLVIMYADKITESMQKTIDETNRRREIQMKYNEEHNIKPKALNKAKKSILGNISADKETDKGYKRDKKYAEKDFAQTFAAEPAEQIYSKENLDSVIEQTRKAMQEAAKKLEFIEAAQLRDKLIELEKLKNAK